MRLRLIVLALMAFAGLLLAAPVEGERVAAGAGEVKSRGGKGARREFTFARLEYNSFGRGSSWDVDWPKADVQFLLGLKHWVRSGLEISEDPATVAIDSPELFEHQFIYIVEPGYMEFTAEEVPRLREYLLRGGFLMLDDFWGEWEWSNVQHQLRKVLPEYQMQELSLDHPVFHCYFDITEVLQVPNFHNYVYRGRTDEKGGTVPRYHALIDERGRILVFIARNADNGDAWEWIDDPRYPLKYGLGAYRLATNLIIYSMTH